MTLKHAGLALAAAWALAATAVQAAPAFPPLTGRVVDDAQILSPQQEAQISAKLEALETKTTRQMVVATLPSLQGYPIEDFGYQLGRAWGIGQKGQDNGVLFLIAPNERDVRIEVGYGLEPVLTDALSSQILQTAVLPRIRDGDMAGGVVAGTDALVAQLSLDDASAKAKVAEATTKTDWPGLALKLIFAIIVISFLLRRSGRARSSIWGAAIPTIVLGGRGRGGGWGGDWGGGGGGFGGGGGSFGGGGASGRW